MNRLRVARESRGLSQKELGEATGLTATTISRYETGKRKLPNEHIKTVCLHFRVSADYLLDLPTDLQDPRKR